MSYVQPFHAIQKYAQDSFYPAIYSDLYRKHVLLSRVLMHAKCYRKTRYDKEKVAIRLAPYDKQF